MSAERKIKGLINKRQIGQFARDIPAMCPSLLVRSKETSHGFHTNLSQRLGRWNNFPDVSILVEACLLQHLFIRFSNSPFNGVQAETIQRINRDHLPAPLVAFHIKAGRSISTP